MQAPDIGGLYNRSAKYHGAERNPVIVIPGILGSKLISSATGEVVWGAFGGGSANPQTEMGAQLISLPMKDAVPLRELTDEVVPHGALDEVKINFFGVPVSLAAYANILATLGAGGYRDEQLGYAGGVDYGGDHFTCFQFAYDWRRDNVENAIRLHQFILEKKKYVEEKLWQNYGVRKDIKFDIVAHSMGGLITRYYLTYGPHDLPTDGSLPKPTWEGAQYVDRALLVGTPNAGSVDSLITLLDGLEPSKLLPKYDAALLGTIPSVHQLLPRPRHGHVINKVTGEPIDILNPDVWEQLQWGMANPNQQHALSLLLPDITDSIERRRIALDQQRKALLRAKQFQDALDAPVTYPANVQLSLVSGDAVATADILAVDPASGATEVVRRSPGDGSVLRSSALLDERVAGAWAPKLTSPIHWHSVTFLFDDHIGLTKDPIFTDNVLYFLLEEPRV